jgi:hypothetical protein
MWLLDVNLPNGLARLLHGYGISCDTVARRDWRDRKNGAPADAAGEALVHRARFEEAEEIIPSKTFFPLAL